MKLSKLCIPYLKKSSHAHILTMSPPLSMKVHWFSNHVAYTMAKYGMSMCVLGMHEEFRPFNIAVNALWPRTMIQTAAADLLVGKDFSDQACRKASIVADAAYAILTQDPKPTGQFFIDDEILAKSGVNELTQYAVDPTCVDKLLPDLFLDDITISQNLGKSEKPAGTVQQSADTSGGAGKVAGIFKAVEGTLDKAIVDKTQAVYQFVVTGEEAGKWYLDLKTGTGKCGKGEPEQKADATLTMDSNNFFAMFSGKLKPAAAFMTGKLKISGNMQLALKLDKLMAILKTKL